MELSPELRAQLLEVFRGELGEQLTIARQALDRLQGDADSDDGKEALETVSRVAHNLKGATRGIGIDDGSEIAYAVETFAKNAKEGTVPWSGDFATLCREAFIKIEEATQAYGANEPAPFDPAEIIGRIRAHSAG